MRIHEVSVSADAAGSLVDQMVDIDVLVLVIEGIDGSRFSVC